MSARQSVERIPGGVDTQIESIEKILEYVDPNSPFVDELEDWIDDEFDLDSESRPNSIISFLISLDIFEKDGNIVNTGIEGVGWLSESAGSETYYQTLASGIVGLDKITEKLFDEEATAEELNDHMSQTEDIDWDTTEQVKRRLDLLRSIDFVELDDGKYSLTVEGEDYLVGELETTEFKVPPEIEKLTKLTDNGDLPEVYLINQPIYDYEADLINIPDENKFGIEPHELSVDTIYLHLVKNKLRGYSRQSERTSVTTDDGTQFSRVPVNKIEFESPIDIGQVLDELVDLESVDRPDNYPFSPTGLRDITIGELGDSATETILDAIDIDLTYGEAVPEHDFESHPTESDIENLYYPGENVLAEIIDQMNQALRDGHHIVLVGPPGTGKSELAKQVASSLTDRTFTMVTATADWSSFDTIGGYQPEGQSGLNFSPGVFLERFQDEDGNPKNEWLIVDELNRANVDKAFGPLFSTLADDSVTTSFKDDQGNEIELVTKEQVAESPTVDHRYCIPDTWRLIATMNTHDKMSLFDLSYAFIRRFAFIHVGAPDESEIETEDIKEYLRRWGIEIIDDGEDASSDEETESDEDDEASESAPDEEEAPESSSKEGASELSGATLSEEWVEQIEHFWSNLQPHRAVGPAVIEKVATTLCKEEVDLTRPTKMYVIPQLEDLPRQTQIAAIESLVNSELDLHLDGEEIISFSEDYLGLNRDNLSA